MKVLVTGGCKNGKSFYAQKLVYDLAGSGKKQYIATMHPTDQEDRTRIARHVKERAGYGYITIEQPKNISECFSQISDNDSVLLDSTTALLMNEMFKEDGSILYNAEDKIIPELVALCNKVKNIAIVSDWIYSDAFIYDDISESYRKSLAVIDLALAKHLDSVREIVFSNVIFHKGGTLT